MVSRILLFSSALLVYGQALANALGRAVGRELAQGPSATGLWGEQGLLALPALRAERGPSSPLWAELKTQARGFRKGEGSLSRLPHQFSSYSPHHSLFPLQTPFMLPIPQLVPATLLMQDPLPELRHSAIPGNPHGDRELF